MKFLILILIVGFFKAENTVVEAQQEQTRSVVSSTQKMRPRSVNIYINQHDTIELPDDIERIDMPPNVCEFNYKRPMLTQVLQAQVNSSSKNSNENTLLHRLRSIKDENTEWLGLAGDMLYVLSGTSWMNVYSAKDLQEITRYELNQRRSQHLPFIMNNEVVVVMEDGIFVCSNSSRKLVSNPRKVEGSGLQISPFEFLVYNPTELVIYSYEGENFKVKEVITKAIMKKSDSNWVKCKKINQYVFCLDSHHGLFRFDPEHMTNYNEISKKVGCEDFEITPSSQGDVTVLQCMFNGQLFLHHEPAIVKAEYLLHYIHDMNMVPEMDNLTVYVKKSTMTFQNLIHRDQTTTEGSVEPIVKLAMRKENSDTYFYILYKDRVVKKMLKFSKPTLTCYSREPVSMAEDVKLVTTAGEEKILPLRISIVEQKIMTPNKNVLIIGLMLIVVGLIVFIGIIYHYEKVERSVSLIYRSHRLREQNRKKGQVAVPI